jgi:3-phenylpropionate/trans-cinnamate dioxygenase ferredoxin reductase subunit
MTGSVETIVIIGAGQAGGWAARTLRAEGYAGRIVLIGDEPHPPYERPPLSKAVLARESAPQKTYLFSADALAELDLAMRPGARAVAILRAAKQVVLEAGERIGYDKLILCTGGRARTLSVPGADLPGVHLLRTIEDSLAIGAALDAGHRRLVVIGGGWIGLEVAATARKRGADVTVVEACARVCERTVPAEISDHLLRLHTRQGVRTVLNRGLAGFVPLPDGGLRVNLDDGSGLEADLAVVGVGIVANDDIARNAGIACANGVLVDAQCRTSDPDVFAAGDVAVTPNRWAGRRVRLESWQNAQDQGIAAAKSALGREVRYDPLPWFWSDQYDMNLQIYGLPSPSHSAVIRGERASGSFLAFYCEAGQVKAAVGVNCGRDLRFARRLIEQGKDVDTAQLADPAVPLSKL